MSHIVEINNTLIAMELETVEQINADSKPVMALYRALMAFAAFGDLSEIELTADQQNPDLFTYQATPNVGAALEAAWLFDDADDNDPSITATITAWDLSILEFGGVVRHRVIAIRTIVGLVSLNVVFP